MNPDSQHDLSSRSMLELFRAEAESQTALLTSGLLELERGPADSHVFASLMRAAHSLKGAARIVNLHVAVGVAHVLEDCFVAAQHGQLQINQGKIDLLFRGVDLLANLAKRPEAEVPGWETQHALEIQEFLRSAGNLISTNVPGPVEPPPARVASTLADTKVAEGSPARLRPGQSQVQPSPGRTAPISGPVLPARTDPADHGFAIRKSEPGERIVRLGADNLNRLLGLASESLVESRWLRPFADSLQRLKRQQMGLAQEFQELHHSLSEDSLSERAKDHLEVLSQQIGQSQQFLAERIQELDLFDRRSAHLSQRLYLEALRTRMRPFNDGVRRFPRMVRDLARTLGKAIRLEISGENTQVDRDILERLETPLAHLLRNAVDHGCETAEERRRAGKPAECTLQLEARHSAGVLLVTVSDDGTGVDFSRVREAIVKRGLASPLAASKLTEHQLLEFLFLPGFTLKETVTEISGRGFGLDIVQNMVKGVRGAIRLSNQPGRGLRVQLQLPLTLSVLRALLVEVAGEPYAIPLNQIRRTLKLPRTGVETFGGRHHFHFSGQPVTLLAAHHVLECGAPGFAGHDLPVVMVGDRNASYGLAVDQFLGERELVVQPLDPRLGKITDISAAALMEDGAPVLIIDVEEILHSIEKLVADGRLANLQHPTFSLAPHALKRVLAVDDSLTVRELQRKLLSSHGYHVDVAADGLEAWNALCSCEYDLVITDVDMPRMNGIELVGRIKQGSLPKSIPVLMVSYKDGEEERLRGLGAGADYYLTKGTFHDQTLLQAVTDLIGGPDA